MNAAKKSARIVLMTIVVALSLLGAVVQPVVAAGELNKGDVVKVLGLGFRYLGCWMVIEKRPWVEKDRLFFEEYCDKRWIDLRGQTGTVEVVLEDYVLVRIGDYSYWYPCWVLQKVSTIILKAAPKSTPVVYLPECGVPITPTPDTSYNWCQRVTQWGDTIWDWGAGDNGTINAIIQKNGTDFLIAGKKYLVPCN